MTFNLRATGKVMAGVALGIVLLPGIGTAWGQKAPAANPPSAPAAPEVDPDSPESIAAFGQYFLKGYEKESAGDFVSAYALYTKAHDIRDDSPALLIRRAYCGAKTGQTKEVAMDLKRAFELQPKTMTDYSTMAWFYATSPFDAYRDGARAVTLGKKIMTTEITADAYDILAAGYAEMGNFSEARDLLMKGIKSFPNSPRIPDMKQHLALYNDKKKFREVWLEDSATKPEKKGWFW